MDDDREAYEFAYALYLARQVDREAAQMIVQAAEVGSIQIDEATALSMRLPTAVGGPAITQGGSALDRRLEIAFKQPGFRRVSSKSIPVIGAGLNFRFGPCDPVSA